MQSSSHTNTVCAPLSPQTELMPYIEGDDNDNMMAYNKANSSYGCTTTTTTTRIRQRYEISPTRSMFHQQKTARSIITRPIIVILLLSILSSSCSSSIFGISFASAEPVATEVNLEEDENIPSLQPIKKLPTIPNASEKQPSGSFEIHSNFLPEGLHSPATPTTTKPSKPPYHPQMTLSQILVKAGRISIGGGIPGAIAGVAQVLTLMWLRTLTSYQCRYGTSLRQAFATLYREGGIPRFYRGLSFALVQAPLVRFVSTAANDGVETLLAEFKLTDAWGPGRTTVIASVVVGVWRMVLMPIDTCKTVLQVDSVEGFRDLVRKLKAGKLTVLYEGAVASVVASIVSHYPWFYTYNYLSRSNAIHEIIPGNFLRNAAIGFLSSVVSDTTSNVVRVIKTTKQAFASKHSVSYGEVVGMILAADGWKGLFGRGLRTRLLGNAAQSVLFTVIWRGLVEKKNKRRRRNEKSKEEEQEESSS